MAQIAAEVRRGRVKNPKSVKVQDFLLTQKAAVTEKSKQSKQVWAAALNIKLKKD